MNNKQAEDEITKKYKVIRSKMLSKESTEEIVKNIAIQFHEWSLENTQHKVGAIRSMKMNSNHLFNSTEELFDYWLHNIYKL